MNKQEEQEIAETLGDITDGFLPEGYDVPSSDSNYMKLEDGENKFRILQSPILGYELWIDKKPKRYPMDTPVPIEDQENADIDERTGEPRPAKHFWAMVVYNYQAKKVQILELTQKTILRTIKGLAKSEDWGSPLNYDISIIKEGKSFETNYETVPTPPKPLSKEVADAWEAVRTKIDVKALYKGENPFAGEL